MIQLLPTIVWMTVLTTMMTIATEAQSCIPFVWFQLTQRKLQESYFTIYTADGSDSLKASYYHFAIFTYTCKAIFVSFRHCMFTFMSSYQRLIQLLPVLSAIHQSKKETGFVVNPGCFSLQSSMALPRAHQQAFTPREIEFLAGYEEITIIPTHRMPRLDLIEESYGPFRPPLKAKVPLWLALMMKKNNRCNILAPEWLSTESLAQRLQEEEQDSEFSALPFHYMEIAQMLLETAPDDIPDAEEVRRLLKDLRETRQSKARVGLAALDHKWLGVNNLSLMEINEIRPFFTKAFLEMRKLSEATGRP